MRSLSAIAATVGESAAATLGALAWEGLSHWRAGKDQAASGGGSPSEAWPGTLSERLIINRTARAAGTVICCRSRWTCGTSGAWRELSLGSGRGPRDATPAAIAAARRGHDRGPHAA